MPDPTEGSDDGIACRILAMAIYTLFLTLGAIDAIAMRGHPVTIDAVLMTLMTAFN